MASVLRIGLLTGALVAAAAAAAAPVAKAGEWETVIGQRTTYVCLPKDKTFDIEGLAKVMPGGGKCEVHDLHTAGAVTTFAMACDVGGGHMTTNNTLTVTGAESYTMHATSHMTGGPQAIPDMDITQVSHRTGACQPRDRMAKDYSRYTASPVSSFGRSPVSPRASAMKRRLRAGTRSTAASPARRAAAGRPPGSANSRLRPSVTAPTIELSSRRHAE